MKKISNISEHIPILSFAKTNQKNKTGGGIAFLGR
jgi:hypothetical protein